MMNITQIDIDSITQDINNLKAYNRKLQQKRRWMIKNLALEEEIKKLETPIVLLEEYKPVELLEEYKPVELLEEYKPVELLEIKNSICHKLAESKPIHLLLEFKSLVNDEDDEYMSEWEIEEAEEIKEKIRTDKIKDIHKHKCISKEKVFGIVNKILKTRFNDVSLGHNVFQYTKNKKKYFINPEQVFPTIVYELFNFRKPFKKYFEHIINYYDKYDKYDERNIEVTIYVDYIKECLLNNHFGREIYEEDFSLNVFHCSYIGCEKSYEYEYETI